MKIHINYAQGRYTNSQRICCDTAISHGGFDRSIAYGLKDLDEEFKKENSYILSHARGAGYWLWKPYLILRHLKEMGSSDWLMYTDSGMYFQRSPWEWVHEAEDQMGDTGIMTFGWCGTQGMFTKRDCFVLMGMDTEEMRTANQRMASIFVCRKTPKCIDFVEEWLRYAKDPRIITDLPNTQRLPNYDEFKDHRHDQSIMSLLTWKHNTFVYSKKDITQYSNSVDPCIIHTRNPA
jgi:hypothetical protein